MSVSVVIAAHDEAQAIARVVAACRQALGPDAQILVVDDGSTDGTTTRALEAGAEVLRLKPNRGKGVAVRLGLQRTRGDVVVLIDGDGQDDPAEIPQLVQALRPGVAMVVGSRFLGRLEKGAISPVNLVGNLALTGLFDLLFGTLVTDTQAGFRALDGRLARELALASREYEIETEMLAAVLRQGGKVIEVPVTRKPRQGGRTDFRRVHNGLRILGTILRERVRR